MQKVSEVRDETADIFFVALLASLIEYTNTALLMANKQTAAGDDSVFRSFLEGYVDLKNLADDEKYLRVLMLDYHCEWLRLFKHADGANPYLESIAAHESAADSKKWHEQQVTWLKKKKVPRLKIADKFKRADMQHEYKSIYNFSSGEAHNNFRALIRRNLDRDENGWTVRVNFWNESRCLPRFDSYAGLLISALDKTNQRFKLSAEKTIEAAQAQLDAARKLDIEEN
tara:strand:+ start:19045 stop:19728 length:684 start_codon:yes stop_codon:yes gene_type:complete